MKKLQLLELLVQNTMNFKQQFNEVSTSRVYVQLAVASSGRSNCDVSKGGEVR